jgi:hypothetical protein
MGVPINVLKTLVSSSEIALVNYADVELLIITFDYSFSVDESYLSSSTFHP